MVGLLEQDNLAAYPSQQSRRRTPRGPAPHDENFASTIHCHNAHTRVRSGRYPIGTELSEESKDTPCPVVQRGRRLTSCGGFRVRRSRASDAAALAE